MVPTHEAFIDERLAVLSPAQPGQFLALVRKLDHTAVRFEIATDDPGFAADEDPAHWGETLALPPFLEPRRAAIEANLKPIAPVTVSTFG